MYYQQTEYNIRCEWGLAGINHLASDCDVVVIVDVLSFSTCVDVAVGRGAIVYPYSWNNGKAEEFAAQKDAILANARRSADGYTLSPSSLVKIHEGTKLVLPSPNGSTLTLATGSKPTLAGCLRNAQAVARAAQSVGERILVVPAGERWPDHDHTLRPAIEDLIGAGAIISYLQGYKSPEAWIAQEAYESAWDLLYATLEDCSSGRELIERGFKQDISLAADLNCSDCVPFLREGAYANQASS